MVKIFKRKGRGPVAGARRRLRRLTAAAGAAAIALVGVGVPVAGAATVSYELTGSWESQPVSVQSGKDPLSATWRFDINDGSPAPSNDPVDNNTVTFVAQNAVFTRLPSECLTTGVDPVSSLSADGKTMVCNIGTRDQGTAQIAFTGLVPQGKSGDEVTVAGTFMGKTVDLPKIPIMNAFAMDAKFNAASSLGYDGPRQDVTFGWSLSHSSGSLDGPSSVSYDLTIGVSNGEAVSVDNPGCSAISDTMSGYPYSDGAHAATRSTDFPGCTLTSLGGGKYRLTLTGLSYTGPFPSQDSAGNPLPGGMDVIASGKIAFTFPYVAGGTMTLSASAPTYVAAADPAVTSKDDTANNTNSLSYIRGNWSHGFLPTGVLAQGTPWQDTYRAPIGSSVLSVVGAAGAVGNGMCDVLDTKYVTFESAQVSALGVQAPYSGVTLWYYTGTGGGLLDPASASYNPNAWTGCHTDSPGLNGWTNVLPSDLSTVKAVYVVQTQAMINQGLSATGLLNLYVSQKLKPSAAVGQDVWNWGSVKLNGSWWSYNRGSTTATMTGPGTATPGSRYAYAAVGRDVLRVIGSMPVVEKEVAQKEAGPGTQVDYTVRYGLSAPPGTSTPAQVVVTDTLPAGLAYVAGSAVPAPVVTGTAASGQTLSWTINNVAVNKSPLDALTFKAEVPASAVPGTTYKNTVTARSQGQSATASADFTVPKGGYTTLKKTAAQASVPSVDGVAKDSWTVTMKSFDPVTNAKTDVIDILPYLGDGRGTDFNGSYVLDGPVSAAAGTTVYYTTADPATLKEDPKDASNGGFASVAGNTVGWSTTYTANASGVRVIGPSLAYGASQSFTVKVVTSGSKGGDSFVNLAVGRATDSQLRMRTSSEFAVTSDSGFELKKEVQDADGVWHDAQDASDYPSFALADSPRYRVIVKNTGNADLAHLPVSDDKAELGKLFSEGKLVSSSELEGDASGVFIKALPAKGTVTIEYTLPLAGLATEGENLVNTACVYPPSGEDAPAKACDPAGVKLLSSLAWNKIGPHSTTDFLKESEWSLVRVDADTHTPLAGAIEVAVTDCVADAATDCTGTDTDHRGGRFHVTGLITGSWYRLTETRAPVGYQLSAEPQYVFVDGATTAGGYGIVNQLAEVPHIPLTGGTGSLTFWSASGLTGLFIIAGLIWQRRRTTRA